jgi:pimeloyl-ACP methyl ester carboxylesterase
MNFVLPSHARMPGACWWAGSEDRAALVRDIGGFRIRVARVGPRSCAEIDRSPNVFLAHGLVDSSDTWRALLPALHHCTVWLFDLPWSGREGVSWPHVMSATDWWREAIKLCPVSPTVCIGHSFGATVLLDWLAGSSDADTQGMLVLSPFYCAPGCRLRWTDIDTLARGVPGRLGQALRVRMGQADASDALLDAMATKLSARVMPDGLIELFRVFLKSRSWPLAKLALPLAIGVGQHEGKLLEKSSSDLAAKVPSATLTRFSNCGHDPMHEQPQQLREMVRAFVASVASHTTVQAARTDATASSLRSTAHVWQGGRAIATKGAELLAHALESRP